uniref:Uncharacterized protein n=2 Tax=Sus scrofa TaxID=9823 RepID=A0A4X1TQ75_PIG
VKMQRTIGIRQDDVHYIQKYNCFRKHHENMTMPLPHFRDVQISDMVTAGECQALSKTVHFHEFKLKAAGTKEQFQKF